MSDSTASVCDAIVQKLHPVLVDVVQRHPELRSVAVVFDYCGHMNHAPDVTRGVWIGPEGPVRRPDAVVGALAVTLWLLSIQQQRGQEVLQELHDALAAAGRAVLQAGEVGGVQAEPGTDERK